MYKSDEWYHAHILSLRHPQQKDPIALEKVILDVIPVFLDLILPKYSDLLNPLFLKHSEFRRFFTEIRRFGSHSNKNLNLDHYHLLFMTFFQLWTIFI